MIPRSAKDIIDQMIQSGDTTVKQLAGDIGVSQSTIYRLRRGARPSSRLDLDLISLYLIDKKG